MTIQDYIGLYRTIQNYKGLHKTIKDYTNAKMPKMQQC